MTLGSHYAKLTLLPAVWNEATKYVVRQIKEDSEKLLENEPRA